MPKLNRLYEQYENGECPDCGDLIDENVSNGDDCPNCGHVFILDEFLGHDCEH